MAGRRRGDDDEPSAFREALGEVRPVRGRGREVEPPRPGRPAGGGRRSRVRPPAEEAAARFEIRSQGERREGSAPGIDRRHLERLRAGAIPVDRRVDLHGLRADVARRAVQDALARTWQEEGRCLLVVHGRGQHSAEGPVLKQALVEWLARPPWGARVMAFASARREHGGEGATYVLLRRRRRPA